MKLKKGDQEKKSVLLGNFSEDIKVRKVLKSVEKNLDIPKCDVFIYCLNRSSDYFITFKLDMEPDERVDFKRLVPNTIPIHKKGEAYYTINAMNRLIETTNSVDPNIIDHQAFEIDWSEYQNQLILLENDELVFHDIVRIF